MQSLFAQLLSYEEWACRRTLQSLHQPNVPEKAFLIFSHLLAAQQIWMERITEKPRTFALWETMPLDEMEKILERFLAEAVELIESLPEESFQRAVNYTNMQGTVFSTPLNEILMHLSHHSAYHRGQVAVLLRDAGLVPPVTDFIAFVREK